jgi:hypothetical protein
LCPIYQELEPFIEALTRHLEARVVDPPPMRMTGGPALSRSKAMVVPSLERTLSMYLTISLGVVERRPRTGSCGLPQVSTPVEF